jgi:hypothetical protein
LLPTLAQTMLPAVVRAQGTQAAPLASWNDGPAKQAIIDFVRATTDQSGARFVPVEDRVATSAPIRSGYSTPPKPILSKQFTKH